MRFSVLVMAAALAGLCASAQAQTPAPNQSTAATTTTAKLGDKPAPDPNRVVCRKEAITGSRFEKRICMTQAEWDQQTADAERNQARINQQAGLGHAMAGGGLTGQ